MEQNLYVKSLFKSEKLTRETYTRTWIELISCQEQRKNAKITQADEK